MLHFFFSSGVLMNDIHHQKKNTMGYSVLVLMVFYFHFKNINININIKNTNFRVFFGECLVATMLGMIIFAAMDHRNPLISPGMIPFIW